MRYELMRKLLFGFLASLCILPLCAWDDGCAGTTPDGQQAAAQKNLQREETAEVGMPNITNFTEAKLVRHLYELRDTKVATEAYIQDMNGRLWHLCPSIGYGLPYAVQFSNPERPAESWETHEQGNITLPQAEPNGLFMPSTAEGTWIVCVNHGKEQPVYVEPRVIVSPFKLQSAGEYAAR